MRHFVSYCIPPSKTPRRSVGRFLKCVNVPSSTVDPSEARKSYGGEVVKGVSDSLECRVVVSNNKVHRFEEVHFTLIGLERDTSQ